jgi:uncharacterized protein (DUF1684 family)
MTTGEQHDHADHDEHGSDGGHDDHEHGSDGGHEHHDHHEHHEHSYEAAIAGYRAEKDAFFKTSQNSPIPADERDAFDGLPYYPLDVDLVFEGLRLEPYAGNEPTSFQIPTSDGKLRPARRAGTFTFDLGGAPRRLTAYTFESGPSESLFVPFLDETSGHETYGAGRYLDLEPDDDGTYAIDFNLAYHPSCVYAPQYSCPLTPAENRLSTRIEAGERLGEGAAEH